MGNGNHAYASPCPDILRPPIEVKRGEQYGVTIRLSPWMRDPAKNRFWRGGDIEGIYRIRERVYGEWSIEKHGSGTLESEVIFSNRFEIRKPS